MVASVESASPGLPPGSRDLDAKLAAALERLGQALRLDLRDQARRHGLSPTQAQIVLRLAWDPPPRRRVGMLAAALDVTQPTISDAVAVLERKQLVERGCDSADARLSMLRLSDRGAELAAGLEDADRRVRGELAGAGEEEKERALRLLLELIAGLHRAGAIGVSRMCLTCRFFRPARRPGAAAPHHCALLDLPLAGTDLRVDCPEHQAA